MHHDSQNIDERCLEVHGSENTHQLCAGREAESVRSASTCPGSLAMVQV